MGDFVGWIVGEPLGLDDGTLLGSDDGKAEGGLVGVDDGKDEPDGASEASVGRDGESVVDGVKEG